MVKTASTAYINDKELFYQAKEVNPTKRLSINETPGRYGCSIDDMKEGGLDITIDALAIARSSLTTLQERDSIVAAFMKEGRGIYKPGGMDVGWQYTGVCGDRSSSLKLNQLDPTKGYPMSFLFRTDSPFLESDTQKSSGRQITANAQTWNVDTIYPGNILKNWAFENWSSGTSNVAPDYWRTGINTVNISRTTFTNLGTYALLLTGNGTTTPANFLYQTVALETNVSYTFGMWIKSSGINAGVTVMQIVVDGTQVAFCQLDYDTNSEWVFVANTVTLANATGNAIVQLYQYGPVTNNGAFVIDSVVLTKTENFTRWNFGIPITTTGTVATEPDIEVSSANTWVPNLHKYATPATTNATTYALRYTLSMDVVAGHGYRVDEYGFYLKTSNALGTAWARLTIQSSGSSIYNGVETQVGEWSSTITTDTTANLIRFSNPVSCEGGTGESVVLRLYLRNTNGSYTTTASSIYCWYTMKPYPQYPTAIQIYNNSDPLTKLRVCNTLYPGMTQKINADGTGSYKYVDTFDTWDYASVCYATSGSFHFEDMSSVQINSLGYLTIPIDTTYPITGIPVLTMYIDSPGGMPQISIAEDVNGAPGTFYYCPDNAESVITGTWQSLLYNAENLPLANKTKFYVKILANGGATLFMSYLEISCDLQTIDAERPKLLPSVNNTMGALVQGDTNFNCALYWHDKKWGI